MKQYQEAGSNVKNDVVTKKQLTGGADLSIFVRKLESLNQSKCFINGPSHGEIVNSDLSELALPINNKQTPERECTLVNRKSKQKKRGSLC